MNADVAMLAGDSNLVAAMSSRSVWEMVLVEPIVVVGLVSLLSACLPLGFASPVVSIDGITMSAACLG